MSKYDCNDNRKIRVVFGNDLTVEALVSVYDEDKGYYASFDLTGASDVKMMIVGAYSKVEGENVTVSGSKAKALFKAGRYGAGNYGVEITFTRGQGSFRVFERDLFSVVMDSGEASLGTSAEGGSGEGMNISVDVRSRTLRVGQVSGITDYNLLENRPAVNGHTLAGDQSAHDLGLATVEDTAAKVDKEPGKGLSANDLTNERAGKVDMLTKDGRANEYLNGAGIYSRPVRQGYGVSLSEDNTVSVDPQVIARQSDVANVAADLAAQNAKEQGDIDRVNAAISKEETDRKAAVAALQSLIDTLNSGYQFMGVATPEINPGTPDQKVFYIANGKGTYANFGGVNVTEDDVVVLYYDTEWHKVSTGIASQAKLSELDKMVTVERQIAIEGVLGDGIVFGNSVGNPVVFNTAYPTKWKHDSFILHPNADHSLTINKYPNGGAYQYVICDDNDIVLWLRRSDSADLFGTDSTKTNVRLDIPCIDGQAKLYACHIVSTDSHASVSTFLKENRIEGIDATLEQLNNSIEEVDTRVTELENSLFANATPYTTLGKQYIYSNGEIRTLIDAFYVDVYKLGTSEKYRIKSTIPIAATAAKSYAFYSSDNLSPSTLVGSVATTSLEDTIDIMLEIPSGAKFLAVSKHTSADIVVATNKKSADVVNIFESLHFAVDGDSITQEVSKNQWAYYCQQILGFASKSNVAFGGACWAYKRKTSIDGTRTITPQEPADANYVGYDNSGNDLSTDINIQKFVNNNAITHTKDYLQKVSNGTYPTPDIFVYALGTNQDEDDVNGGEKVSVESAMSPTNIDELGNLLYSTTGAMRWCLQTIKTRFPDCRVFVSLPIQRVDSSRNYIKPKMKIIKEMAEEMGCQVIPQYYGCGITAAIESATPTYLMDGLHPNDEGNKLMGAFAASQIKSKYFRNKDL